MEPTTKRVKRRDFKNEEEAEEYLQKEFPDWLQLPVEIWVKILSSNPALSVQDIERMCNVMRKNASWFGEMCDSGIIWDDIFKRQFGRETFERVKRFTLSVRGPKVSLRRLMAYRIVVAGTNNNFSWEMKKGLRGYDGNKIVYWSITIRFSKGYEYRFDITADELPVWDAFKYAKSSALVFVPADYSISGYMTDIGREIEDIMQGSKIDWRVDDESWEGASYYGTIPYRKRQTKLLMELLNMGLRYIPKTDDKNIYTGSLVLCQNCQNIAKYACGECQKKFYCGQKCAQKDWKQHHRTCSK